MNRTTEAVITWSRLTWMKFCPVTPGFRQCYKLFIKYILRLHVKSFPARWDPSIVLCREEIFPCNSFSPPKPDEKINQKMSISIDRRYFHCVFTTYMTSICEKKMWTNVFVEFHHFAEVATEGVLQKSCS